MISIIDKKKPTLTYRILCGFIALCFLGNIIIPPGTAQAQGIAFLNLPLPGTMVAPTPNFTPVLLRGMTLYPENPLQFDFILDSGNDNLAGKNLQKESEKLIKYFLASLTIPEDDLWVNLSPYEKDRIITKELSKTDLGRDMLAQDYLLKQLTASLMYPEDNLGKEFWSRVRQKAKDKFGTEEIPTNTFNKVWILPDKATIYEHNNTVYVVESRLKVMLDQDYLATRSQVSDVRRQRSEVSNQVSDIRDQNLTSDSRNLNTLLRDIILPEIEKEVNEGKNFATLRQIYHSLILAKWYKETIKESLLSQFYVDQNKIAGIDLEDETIKDQIYAQYIEAFKKGVYDLIKEEYDPTTQEVIPRKYFSGGIVGDVALGRTEDDSMVPDFEGQGYRLSTSLASHQVEHPLSPEEKIQILKDEFPKLASVIEELSLPDFLGIDVLWEAYQLRKRKLEKVFKHFVHGVNGYKRFKKTFKKLSNHAAIGLDTLRTSFRDRPGPTTNTIFSISNHPDFFVNLNLISEDSLLGHHAIQQAFRSQVQSFNERIDNLTHIFQSTTTLLHLRQLDPQHANRSLQDAFATHSIWFEWSLELLALNENLGTLLDNLSNPDSLGRETLREAFRHNPIEFLASLAWISLEKDAFQFTFDQLKQTPLGLKSLQKAFAQSPYSFATTLIALKDTWSDRLSRYITPEGIDLNRFLKDHNKRIVFDNHHSVAAAIRTNGIIRTLELDPAHVEIGYFSENIVNRLKAELPEYSLTEDVTPSPQRFLLRTRLPDLSQPLPTRNFISTPFKFYSSRKPSNDSFRTSLKEKMNIPENRKVILVHSPVLDEIQTAIKAYENLPKSQRPLVILALRYPNYQLKEDLKQKGFRVINRNHENEDVSTIGNQDVVVLNSKELSRFRPIADLSIVGHDRNLFEPARGNIPVLYFDGPWKNNRLALRLLKEFSAAVMIDPGRLSDQITALLDDSQTLQAGMSKALDKFDKDIIPIARLSGSLTLMTMILKKTSDDLKANAIHAPPSVLANSLEPAETKAIAAPVEESIIVSEEAMSAKAQFIEHDVWGIMYIYGEDDVSVYTYVKKHPTSQIPDSMIIRKEELNKGDYSSLSLANGYEEWVSKTPQKGSLKLLTSLYTRSRGLFAEDSKDPENASHFMYDGEKNLLYHFLLNLRNIIQGLYPDDEINILSLDQSPSFSFALAHWHLTLGSKRYKQQKPTRNEIIGKTLKNINNRLKQFGTAKQKVAGFPAYANRIINRVLRGKNTDHEEPYRTEKLVIHDFKRFRHIVGLTWDEATFSKEWFHLIEKEIKETETPLTQKELKRAVTIITKYARSMPALLRSIVPVQEEIFANIADMPEIVKRIINRVLRGKNNRSKTRYTPTKNLDAKIFKRFLKELGLNSPEDTFPASWILLMKAEIISGQTTALTEEELDKAIELIEDYAQKFHGETDTFFSERQEVLNSIRELSQTLLKTISSQVDDETILNLVQAENLEKLIGFVEKNQLMMTSFVIQKDGTYVIQTTEGKSFSDSLKAARTHELWLRDLLRRWEQQQLPTSQVEIQKHYQNLVSEINGIFRKIMIAEAFFKTRQKSYPLKASLLKIVSDHNTDPKSREDEELSDLHVPFTSSDNKGILDYLKVIEISHEDKGKLIDLYHQLGYPLRALHKNDFVTETKTATLTPEADGQSVLLEEYLGPVKISFPGHDYSTVILTRWEYLKTLGTMDIPTIDYVSRDSQGKNQIIGTSEQAKVVLHSPIPELSGAVSILRRGKKFHINNSNPALQVQVEYLASAPISTPKKTLTTEDESMADEAQSAQILEKTIYRHPHHGLMYVQKIEGNRVRVFARKVLELSVPDLRIPGLTPFETEQAFSYWTVQNNDTLEDMDSMYKRIRNLFSEDSHDLQNRSAFVRDGERNSFYYFFMHLKDILEEISGETLDEYKLDEHPDYNIGLMELYRTLAKETFQDNENMTLFTNCVFLMKRIEERFENFGTDQQKFSHLPSDVIRIMSRVLRGKHYQAKDRYSTETIHAREFNMFRVLVGLVDSQSTFSEEWFSFLEEEMKRGQPRWIPAKHLKNTIRIIENYCKTLPPVAQSLRIAERAAFESLPEFTTNAKRVIYRVLKGRLSKAQDRYAPVPKFDFNKFKDFLTEADLLYDSTGEFSTKWKYMIQTEIISGQTAALTEDELSETITFLEDIAKEFHAFVGHHYTRKETILKELNELTVQLLEILKKKIDEDLLHIVNRGKGDSRPDLDEAIRIAKKGKVFISTLAMKRYLDYKYIAHWTYIPGTALSKKTLRIYHRWLSELTESWEKNKQPTTSRGLKRKADPLIDKLNKIYTDALSANAFKKTSEATDLKIMLAAVVRHLTNNPQETGLFVSRSSGLDKREPRRYLKALNISYEAKRELIKLYSLLGSPLTFTTEEDYDTKEELHALSGQQSNLAILEYVEPVDINFPDDHLSAQILSRWDYFQRFGSCDGIPDDVEYVSLNSEGILQPIKRGIKNKIFLDSSDPELRDVLAITQIKDRLIFKNEKSSLAISIKYFAPNPPPQEYDEAMADRVQEIKDVFSSIPLPSINPLSSISVSPVILSVILVSIVAFCSSCGGIPSEEETTSSISDEVTSPAESQFPPSVATSEPSLDGSSPPEDIDTKIQRLLRELKTDFEGKYFEVYAELVTIGAPVIGHIINELENNFELMNIFALALLNDLPIEGNKPAIKQIKRIAKDGKTHVKITANCVLITKNLLDEEEKTETLFTLLNHVTDQDALTAKSSILSFLIIGPPVLPFLYEVSQDSYKRVSAATVFKYFGQDAIPFLIKKLESENIQDKMHTCILFKRMGPRAFGAKEALIKTLQTPAKYAAIEALAEVAKGDKETAELLLTLLNDKDSAIRMRAAAAVGKAVPGIEDFVVYSAVLNLHKTMADPDHLVRRESALAISRFGKDAIDIALPKLKEMAQSDPNRLVRLAAKQAIEIFQEYRDPTIEKFLEFLQEDDSDEQSPEEHAMDVKDKVMQLPVIVEDDEESEFDLQRLQQAIAYSHVPAEIIRKIADVLESEEVEILEFMHVRVTRQVDSPMMGYMEIYLHFSNNTRKKIYDTSDNAQAQQKSESGWQLIPHHPLQGALDFSSRRPAKLGDETLARTKTFRKLIHDRITPEEIPTTVFDLKMMFNLLKAFREKYIPLSEVFEMFERVDGTYSSARKALYGLEVLELIEDITDEDADEDDGEDDSEDGRQKRQLRLHHNVTLYEEEILAVLENLGEDSTPLTPRQLHLASSPIVNILNGAPANWDTTTLENKVRRAVANVARRALSPGVQDQLRKKFNIAYLEEVPLTTTLEELGIDSMASADMAVELPRLIPQYKYWDGDIQEHFSLQELIDRVRRNRFGEEHAMTPEEKLVTIPTIYRDSNGTFLAKRLSSLIVFDFTVYHKILATLSPEDIDDLELLLFEIVRHPNDDSLGVIKLYAYFQDNTRMILYDSEEDLPYDQLTDEGWQYLTLQPLTTIGDLSLTPYQDLDEQKREELRSFRRMIHEKIPPPEPQAVVFDLLAMFKIFREANGPLTEAEITERFKQIPGIFREATETLIALLALGLIEPEIEPLDGDELY